VRMDEKEKLAMENEIGILKNLDHPNILKIHESYECEKRYYIVTDICKGGELFDEITKNKFFTENNAAQVMYALLRCLKYLHEQGIMHRDLKPENLLLEENKNYEQVKLIDFGTAKKFESKDLPITQMVGTPYYIAPEVIKKSYNEKCDLWSAGVIMYIILSGQPPFGGRNEKQIMDNVQNGKFNFNNKVWGNVSPDAKDLINSLLERDVTKRFSAEQALGHKWMTDYKAGTLESGKFGK